METAPEFLATIWILSCFGETLSPAQRAYKKFVRDGMTASGSPWERVSGQVYLGDEEFLDEVHEYIRGRQDIPEIPRQQRLIGRPELHELFASLPPGDKAQRNRIIVESHEKYGYTLKEIAAALGLHYTTISKVLNPRN